MSTSLRPGRRAAPYYPLLLLAAAYLALSTLYNVVSPPFEALDEFHHYPYVKWVADGNGLPVMGPDAEENLYRQEGAQPPLYYLLAAVSTFWIETGGLRQLYQDNPHAMAGDPHAPDNKNLVLHDPREEGFPYRGKYLALHLARLLSTLMGLVTVVATYLLAREASGSDGLVGTAAAALVAFNPMFLFVSGSVNNDNLVNALAALTLLTLTGLVLGKASTLRFCLLGLLVGASALAKLSGLALLPLSLVVLAISSLPQRRWGSFARAAAMVIGLAVAVAGWWYVRNWFLYGDPLGLNVFLSIQGTRSSDLSLLLGELEGLKLSFWGVFGGFNIVMGRLAYWFYDGLSLAAAVGLLALALLSLRRDFPYRPWLLLMHFIWVGAVALALARWTSLTLASQGRLLFPAIPSLALFLGLGLFSFGPARLRGLGVGSLSLLLAGLAAAAPFLYIIPAYPPPPLVSSEEARRFIHPLYINFDDRIALLGYDLAPRETRPGEDVTVNLYWQILKPMEKDYSLFIHLFGRNNLPIGQRDTFLGGGSYPTSQAQGGAYLRDTYRVRVGRDISQPTVARIEVGFYALPAMERLLARDQQGRPLGSSPAIARFKVAVPGAPVPAGFTAVEAAMGDELGLVGYRLGSLQMKGGDTVQGALLWRALRQPSADYTIFIQVVGPRGLVAQYDSQPQGGNYPTSFWDIGEEVEEGFQMVLPPDMQAGQYDLIAGMYDLATGARLPLGGRDHVWLASISVEDQGAKE